MVITTEENDKKVIKCSCLLGCTEMELSEIEKETGVGLHISLERKLGYSFVDRLKYSLKYLITGKQEPIDIYLEGSDLKDLKKYLR